MRIEIIILAACINGRITGFKERTGFTSQTLLWLRCFDPLNFSVLFGKMGEYHTLYRVDYVKKMKNTKCLAYSRYIRKVFSPP